MIGSSTVALAGAKLKEQGFDCIFGGIDLSIRYVGYLLLHRFST
jgi:hypothetical protein